MTSSGGGGCSAAFFQPKTVPKLYQENGILTLPRKTNLIERSERLSKERRWSVYRGKRTRTSSSWKRFGWWSRASELLKRHGRGSKLTAEQIEIRQLRAELSRVKMERDILGKAAAYFSRGQK